MSTFVSTGYDGLGEMLGELNEQENPLNRSYNSAISNSSTSQANQASASSSKAVLAALRALQDKIRRLETERAQALDECGQLRHQMKNQEIETEHLRQREALTAQKALHEVRSAYEKILTEKTEQDVRFAKIEDRNREEQRLVEELRGKIHMLEDEKHQGLLTIKDLEAEKTHSQSQNLLFQQKEKELGQTILWETKRHEEDMDVLGNKLRTLQSDLSNATQDKSIAETKLLELDQLVSQLLSVNESLVTRLSGKSSLTTTGKGKKSNKKTGAGTSAAATGMGGGYVKPPFVPRAASVSTVSFDYSRRSNAGVPTKTAAAKGVDDADNLHRMHAMYVDLARSITQQQPSPSLSRKKKSGSSSSSSSSSSSTPTGGITGKQLKQSTTILRNSRKNHHQEEGEDDDDGQGLEGMSYYRGGGGGGSGTYNNHNGQGYLSSGNTHTPGGINVRVPSVSFDASTGGGVRHAYRGDHPHSQEYAGGGSPHLMTTPNPPSSHSFYQSTNNGQGQGMGEMNNGMGNNNSSHAYTGIASSSKNSDLASVIASLEEEFAVLNTQYRRLLASVQTQSLISSFSQSPNAMDSNHAEELVSVIQKLHKKGEQLRALKSPSSTSTSTR